MNNWISVEDNLPERYISVLYCTNEGFIGIGYYVGNFPEHGNRWEDRDTFDIILWPVVAWQPLPDPPNNESTKEMVIISKAEYEALLDR